jgi:Flp pilus assembly protein TadD
MAVKYDKLRTETLNAIFRSERLRDSKPEEAVEILDKAIENISKSELSKEAVAPMVNQLNRTKASVEAHAKQHEPMIAQQKRNAEVEDAIKHDIEHGIRIDQEMAKLVEEFNTLMKQERYAEAEVRAKQAKQLNPNNPVTETLVWKAKLRRNSHE